ncbi:MAG: HK97 family phage prohead protease, partial [Proteobacteria bacterium]|nr:HK97 family phage prohead protease [Pseudomonadota bacterium]
GTRTLIQVVLWEISVVTFPLLEAASVTAVGAPTAALVSAMREAALTLRAN